MQVSYFENGRYYAPSNLPRQWPMPAGAYDREAGLRAFRGMVERSRYAEELGFDWVSVSEHHYSPRILTPSLPIAAAYIASHVHNIKINAPSSTENAKKARDREMHQTKKDNQWYFGMTAHLGVDSRTKLIHAVAATPANAADSTVLPDLLHGKETRVWDDQAYRGQRAVIRRHAPKAQDFTNRRYRHRGVVDEIERAKNRTKSKIRARVEHAIGVIKRVFGFAKVRYRGLNKNTHRLLVTCALANLFMARRHLLRGATA